MIKENVGSQDQVATAFGGLNRIEFLKRGGLKVTPLTIGPTRMNLLKEHLILSFTGVTRISSQIAEKQIENLKIKLRNLEVRQRLLL